MNKSEDKNTILQFANNFILCNNGADFRLAKTSKTWEVILFEWDNVQMQYVQNGMGGEQ